MKKFIIFFLLIFAQLLFTLEIQKVVAIGDSLFAGFTSGGLMIDYQKNSIPALVARSAGVLDFEQPYISFPGIPALLELKSLNPVTISQISEENGIPMNLNLPRPYDNLAVPGATLFDCLNKKDGGMNDIILRGIGTQVEQAVSLNPDLLIVWIGNNDVLGAAISGTAIPGMTITPKEVFEAYYIQLINQIKALKAYVVIANIPDVTSIPFVTTIPPYIINPLTGQPVLDQNGNPITYLGQSDTGSPFISPDSYVLLTAMNYISLGYGIPVELGGKGEPLPDHVILTPNETTKIKEYLNYFNLVIKREAMNSGFAFFDVFSFFNKIKENGIEIAGMHFSADFLRGGLFSYDGVHPTALGYAFLANEFINEINKTYGLNLKQNPISPFVFETTPSLPYENSEKIFIKDWEEWMSIFVKNVIFNYKKIF